MKILGISAFYHDSAAALVIDGKIIAAAQEERFTRKKHDAGYPGRSIDYCLAEAGLKLSQIDFVTFYDKPFLKFERLHETYLTFAPKGFGSFRKAMPLWIKDKLFQRSQLRKKLRKLNPHFEENKILFAEHHLSHAASAFFPSPFEKSAVLVLDGVGEWATSSLGIGEGNRITITKEIHFPHSLGLLYSAFTYYAGFKVNSGEYKLMGLAPYGNPVYRDLILKHLIDLKPDGTYRLNLEYFDYCIGLRMVNHKFEALFGGPARDRAAPITQRDVDIAASVQTVTEEIVLRLTRSAVKESGVNQLCLAGGVALNCVANGKIIRDGIVKDLWIQPAAGDAGGAIGAALSTYYLYADKPRTIAIPDAMAGSYLGPQYSDDEIESDLTQHGAQFTRLSPEDLLDRTTQALSEGKAVGWFQGRMEFGPRALGGRSILGDARSPSMQKILNLKVKFRESFRPFAPAVLREDLNQWFDLDVDSPYMLLVAPVAGARCREMSNADRALFGLDKLNVARSSIPAVTHVDYSARVQTVHPQTNFLFHSLLNRFKARTGCPVLVNTSFNVRGEPIVCTPADAFRCFMGTDIECLAVGNYFLEKSDHPPQLVKTYHQTLEAD